MDIVKSRASCRDYLEEDVPDSVIGKCLEAARLAPSACNKQPWRFVVVKDSSLKSDVLKASLLPGIPMPWAFKAPVLIVMCAELSIVTHLLAPLFSGVKYPLIDLGIAGEHLALEAENLGLGTCWIGWFREKPVKRLLGIPGMVKVVSLMTMGRPASATKAKEKFPLEEIAFLDKWKNRHRFG